MNVRFLLKIPFKVGITKPDGTIGEETRKATLNIDTMLEPFFVSETALLSMFVDECDYGKYGQKAREIAFNSSVRAWEYTKFKLRHLPDEQKLHLVRELALCFALSAFANHFFQGHHEMLHRSKTYAEFTVTTTVRNSPYLLRGILDNANKCLEEIKDEIDQIDELWDGLGLSNLKGSCNPGNAWSWRMWFHNHLPERSLAIFASEDLWHSNGNRYKGGHDVSNARAYYQGRVARSPVYYY